MENTCRTTTLLSSRQYNKTFCAYSKKNLRQRDSRRCRTNTQSSRRNVTALNQYRIQDEYSLLTGREQYDVIMPCQLRRRWRNEWGLWEQWSIQALLSVTLPPNSTVISYVTEAGSFFSSSFFVFFSSSSSPSLVTSLKQGLFLSSFFFFFLLFFLLFVFFLSFFLSFFFLFFFSFFLFSSLFVCLFSFFLSFSPPPPPFFLSLKSPYTCVPKSPLQIVLTLSISAPYVKSFCQKFEFEDCGLNLALFVFVLFHFFTLGGPWVDGPDVYCVRPG